MKTLVKVHLIAHCVIEMEVDHDHKDDPTDLTAEEQMKAERLADPANWQYQYAEVVV